VYLYTPLFISSLYLSIASKSGNFKELVTFYEGAFPFEGPPFIGMISHKKIADGCNG
jgi:hypothetical protein